MRGANVTAPQGFYVNPDALTGGWICKRPYYFPDIDSLATFIQHLLRTFPDTQIAVGLVNVPGVGATDAAAEVAKQPIPQRLHIYLQGHSGEHDFAVYFSQRTSFGPAQTRFVGADASSIYSIITSNASVIPRNKRKSRYPLIEPIRFNDDTHARREQDLAQRSRKSGALWGSITGIGGALLIWVVQELLQATSV